MQYNREMERSVRNTETDHVAVESGQGTGDRGQGPSYGP